MNDVKRDMTRIQELVGNAFSQTGSLVALANGGQMNPNKLQKTLEQTMEQFENAALELRRLCEQYSPGVEALQKELSARHRCDRERGGIWLWLAPYHPEHAFAALPISESQLVQRYHQPASGWLRGVRKKLPFTVTPCW